MPWFTAEAIPVDVAFAAGNAVCGNTGGLSVTFLKTCVLAS